MQQSQSRSRSQSQSSRKPCTNNSDVTVGDARAAQLVLALGFICSNDMWNDFLDALILDQQKKNADAPKMDSVNVTNTLYYMMDGRACTNAEHVEYFTTFAMMFIGEYVAKKIYQINNQNNAQNNNSDEEYNNNNHPQIEPYPPLKTGGGRRPAKTSKNAKKEGGKRAAPRK